MNAIITCLLLDDIRQHIDRLDREPVRLIAERAAHAALHPPTPSPSH